MDTFLRTGFKDIFYLRFDFVVKSGYVSQRKEKTRNKNFNKQLIPRILCLLIKY